MYIIGLIDDEESEQRKIRRTIKTNSTCAEKFEFKTYVIPNEKESAIDRLSVEIINDIENKKITSLIIDYKIMVEAFKVKGTEILKRINENVIKFPVVILTERVDESVQVEYVDADKVYEKRRFFKLDEEYSKEKVNNIFDSMCKYVKQRDSLILEIERLKEKLSDGGRDVIPEILKLEEKLEDFIPIGYTTWDKICDMDKFQGVIDKIEEANRLMGDYDEI